MKLIGSFLLLLFLNNYHAFSSNSIDTLINVPENLANKKLIIGTKEAAPFAIKTANGSWKGISIDLWKHIAQQLGVTYEFREYKLGGLLQAVQNQEVDLAVAALTVTEHREKVIDFTQPFYVSGLGIAARNRDQGIWATIRSIFSWEFFSAVGALVIVILFFGVLVWLFERNKNKDDFGGSVVKGIGAGFWWSAVTMTTVGYGDKAPKSAGGRIIALIWMFMALIIISSFTAAIASALTVNQLAASVKGVEDLKKVRVATVPNSSSAEYLEERTIKYYTYTTPQEALQALAEEKVDAVVYDRPILLYLMHNENLGGNLQILPQSISLDYYGMALSKESELRKILNIHILEFLKSEQYQALLQKYLGDIEDHNG